ncbi:hypothetical protein V8E53_014267 [Lactarius tabidus]
MSISLLKAQLLALCLSTFLYGVFFALVLITTVVMSYKVTDDIRRQRLKILPVSYAMLAVATMHFIVSWIRASYGFVDQKGGSAMAFYGDISNTTSLLKTSCLCLQTVMGDAVVVWRMYVVYGRRFKIIIPAIILVVAYTVVGIFVITISSKVRPGVDIFHVATTWVTAYFSLTMTTNIVLSSKYFYFVRILIGLYSNGLTRVQVQSHYEFFLPHWLIIFTLVESCALYTTNIVATLTAFLSDSFGQYVAMDSIVPMVGISFSLIVLQIRFHVSATNCPRFGSDGRTSVAWHRPDSRPLGAGDEPVNTLRPIRMPIRMAIHVSKQTNTDLNSRDVGKDAYRSSLDMD